MIGNFPAVYFSNSTGSFVTNCQFSSIIGVKWPLGLSATLNFLNLTFIVNLISRRLTRTSFLFLFFFPNLSQKNNKKIHSSTHATMLVKFEFTPDPSLFVYCFLVLCQWM